MARIGLPKKYIKLGGGVTKKAWRLYRAAKSSASKKIKSTFKKKKKTTKKKTTKKKATSKKKYSSKPKTKKRTTMAKKKSKKTYSSRRPKWSTSKAQAIAVDSLIIGGGVLGSTVAINKTPWIKDLKQWQRALTQAAIGIFGVMMTPKKNILMKKFFGGAAVGSVLNFAPMVFPNLTMGAGKNRRLTQPELNAVNMGIPHKFNGKKSMGKPVHLGVPVDMSGGGGRFKQRGHREYAGSY